MSFGPEVLDGRVSTDVAVDNKGNVYVLDILNSQIQKYSPDGLLINRWGRSVKSGDPVTDGDLGQPTAIALDDEGNVYVADSLFHRLTKFSPDGNVQGVWGKACSTEPCITSADAGDGEFNAPMGISIDLEGNVFVVEAGNHRIQKLTPDGTYLTKWGSEGTDNDQFKFFYRFIDDVGQPLPDTAPYVGNIGIAVDNKGSLYVSDTDNNRIMRFTTSGVFQTMWNVPKPMGLALDREGHVFVGDMANFWLRKYSGTGVFLAFGGEYGYEQGQFWEFGGLALNDQGDIYAADLLLGRIQKFDANGGLLLSNIGLDSVYPVAVAVGPLTGLNSDKWNDWTINGFTLGSGTIWVSHYVADTFGNIAGNLKLYKANGEYIGDWFLNDPFIGGIAFDTAANLYVALPAHKNIYKFNATTGEETTFIDPNNDLKNPVDVAVDNNGNVYVVDIGDSCHISKFTSSGTFIKKWLPNGSAGCDQLTGVKTWPTLSTDGSSRLAAAFPALQDDRLQIFNLDGVFQTEIGGSGNIPGRFNWVEGTAFDADGNLYLADRLNSRIQVFKPQQLLNNAKAIIVAGGGPFPGNNLWNTTQMAANAAYWRLAYQGYSKDDITYLSSNTNLDLDGDGTPDVDGDATYTNLHNAIINASYADNLVVYLAGHGGNGSFRIGSNEQVSASEFRTSLDALQNNPGFDDPADPNDGQVFAIYDACESGSFITGLTPSAGKKRVIITSTSPGERAAFISNVAVSFSNYFWNGIFRGEDVRTAFQSAKTAIAASSTGQIPMMDANGDGISNNTDLIQMAGVSIGNGTSVNSDAPTIGAVDTSVTGNTLTVTTTFANPGDIGRVWVVVRPPDLLDTSTTNPVQGLPNFNLLPVSEGSRNFSGNHDALSASGNYELAVYASGTKPRKAVLVAGGELSDANWQAISTKAQLAYTALRKQGYIDNDIQYLGANQNVTGWDAFPSTLTISDAITTWAKSKTQELVIYLVGGGSNQAFRLNQNQILTAVQLDGWLDSLQSTLPGILTIVYDADLSGSFIPLLTPPSGKPRIVVTGTNAVEQANFLGNDSIRFSNYFWSGVFNGDTVWEAWLGAKRAIEFAGTGQSAQLDDDGGGNPNQKTDGSIARYYRVNAGILFAGNEPLLGTVTNAQILAGATTANFSVDGVTSTGTIDRVWAVITAPHGSIAAMAEITMTLDRTDPEGNRYLGSYNGYNNYGTYEVLVYAEDTNGVVSDPISSSGVQTVGPDVYEVDDTVNQSKVVNLNDEKAQAHNFHNAGDKDWVKF